MQGIFCASMAESVEWSTLRRFSYCLQVGCRNKSLGKRVTEGKPSLFL